MYKKILSLILVFSMLLNPLISYAEPVVDDSKEELVITNGEDNTANETETKTDSEENIETNTETETSDDSNNLNNDSETDLSKSEVNELESKNNESETVINEVSKNNESETVINEIDNEEIYSELTYTDEENGIRITVKAENAEDLNHAVSVVATRVDETREKQYENIISNEINENDSEVVIPTVEKVYVYNISLFDKDNQEVEPNGIISVLFSIDELKENLTEDTTLTVYHNKATEAENLEDIKDESNQTNNDLQDITIDSQHLEEI